MKKLFIRRLRLLSPHTPLLPAPRRLAGTPTSLVPPTSSPPCPRRSSLRSAVPSARQSAVPSPSGASAPPTPRGGDACPFKRSSAFASRAISGPAPRVSLLLLSRQSPLHTFTPGLGLGLPSRLLSCCQRGRLCRLPSGMPTARPHLVTCSLAAASAAGGLGGSTATRVLPSCVGELGVRTALGRLQA